MKIIALLKHEIMVQNRAYSIIRYNIQFMLLGIICLLLARSESVDQVSFIMSFIIVGLPLSIISTSRPIIKADISDGSMELLIITIESHVIASIKYLALLINNLVSFYASICFIALFCDLSWGQVITISTASTLLLAQISALSLLTSCTEGYFLINTNLVSLVILPLIIPGIIVSGLILHQTSSTPFIWLLGGIDMIIVPVSILLSSYLIKNIYNR